MDEFTRRPDAYIVVEHPFPIVSSGDTPGAAMEVMA
jgi:hypothetical protein